MKLKDLILENTNTQHPGFLTNKQDITNWLEKYKIKNYTINDDGSVNVDGDVRLREQKFKYFLVKFNKVVGNFECSFCTELKTLQGAPHSVGGFFSCLRCNSLESLHESPQSVGWFFNCYGCNKVESLQGAPQSVGGDFICWDCPNLNYNNVHKKIKQVKGLCWIDRKPNMLGWQLIKGVTSFKINDGEEDEDPEGINESDLNRIFNDNLGSVFDTQEALLEAGYIEEAKL